MSALSGTQRTSIRSIALIVVISCCSLASVAGEASAEDFPPMPHVPALSGEESKKLFELPEGYRLELVLDESVIKEPVVCVFDGNGRLYVAEMRTYMQDIDGTNQKMPLGVVSRHESSRNDGVYDRHTIFADGFVLPRMILPLDTRVIIGQTDTNDLHVYEDTNNDGKSDEKNLFYAGGPRGGNLEHQPSGLIWAMDNWMYMAGNSYRLRWSNGHALKEPTASNGGQWGLSQDDYGKVWFSNAGGERAFVNFQAHIQYAAINLPEQLAEGFMEVWPLVPIPDVQGGARRFRADAKTLNNFSASCGQDIFRGDRLPPDLRGDALLAEPVGRLIRRVKVDVVDGVTRLRNAHDKSEFIRSRDPNFRPVNMCTGPDGCLYIVDMYRGVIQEGNWVKQGSYLRNVVKQYGLDKNVGKGRIWRLVHKDFQPGPQPRMLEETPAQWVSHLSHPNGWWRDTAQKLIVLKNDRSVIPALKEIVGSHANPLARLHAVYCLEGMDALDAALLLALMKDSSVPVRTAAIRASEALLKKGSKELQERVVELASDPEPTVAIQSLMTQKYLGAAGMAETVRASAYAHKSAGLKAITQQLLGANNPVATGQFTDAEALSLSRGHEIYRELCFGCHGYDGKGMPMEGAPMGSFLAPPLSNSRLVMSHKDAISSILLHGLTGAVKGKSYTAQMIAMGDNSNEWIADVSSYVRNSFGNRGAFVLPEDVKRLRETWRARTEPWTPETLSASITQPLSNISEWKVSASHNTESALLALDFKSSTRFDTLEPQSPNMWFQVEFPEPTVLNGIRMDCGKTRNAFPQHYHVEMSMDGKNWAVHAKGPGTPIVEIGFDEIKTRFVRITQTKNIKRQSWHIQEIQFQSPPRIEK